MSNLTCWHCGASLTLLDFGRQDTCRSCGRDTRTCRACIHYDRASNNECRENQADRVVDKERSNFCDYFKPTPRAYSPAEQQAEQAARSELDALFRK